MWPLTYTFSVVRDGSATPVDVSEIQQWIAFDDKPLDDQGIVNPTFRTFTFTPKAAHVGVYTFRVTGTDAGGKSDFVDFKVTVAEVNDAPQLPAVALARQEVDEDATVTYRVPAFTDEETSVLTYTFSVVRVVPNGDDTTVDVSGWVKFDDDPTDDDPNDPLSPTFRTFTFTPTLSTHAGRYKVTVKGEDAGIPGKPKKSVSAEFELEVREVNDEPEPPDAANLPKLPLQAVEDLELIYQVPAFRDEEDDAAGVSLKYSYTVERVDTNGVGTDVSLTWVEFDDDPSDDDPADPLKSIFRQFKFKPSESSHAGDYRFRVTATDAGIGDDDTTEKSAFVEFMLKVIAGNDLPEGQTLPNQGVTEDTPETYSFPKFTDEETSDLTHTASWVRKNSDGKDIVDADGEKVFEDIPVGSWIAFGEDPDDDTKMKFTFSPDKSWHGGVVYTLRVTADDGQGGKTFKVFLLQVSAENDAPVASSLVAQDDVVEDTPSIYVFDAFDGRGGRCGGCVSDVHIFG